MDQLSDDAIIKFLEQSPEEALQAIYHRYSGLLFRFIYRFTENGETAEEILHDIFIDFLSGKFRRQQDGSLKSWLFTLAKNKSLNVKKRSHNARHESLEPTTEIASIGDLEAQTIKTDLLEKLAVSTAQLPPDLLATWRLRQQGHDYRAIAKELMLPIGTVKSRFSRLVEILRKDLV